MSGIYLKCSEELAVKLGAVAAKQVVRNDLSFPVYDVPDGCIEIDVGLKPMAWPLVADESDTGGLQETSQ